MFGAKDSHQGFTLIELSIVLVIVGLIIGGVLVGRDLINSAAVRAQIKQIEKYNQAVNTFKVKFGALPGDMPVSTANQFGFTVGTNCNGNQKMRDGNGLIEAFTGSSFLQGQDEVALFWQDLSSPIAGRLIEQTIPGDGSSFNCSSSGAVVASLTTISTYYPTAKIGNGNYLYVYANNGYNWYGLSAVQSNDSSGQLVSGTSIPVIQAYRMDVKMDDGLPTTGNIIAQYITHYNVINAPNTTVSGGNSTSCYDTTSNNYSINYNNGIGGNCALTIKMQ